MNLMFHVSLKQYEDGKIAKLLLRPHFLHVNTWLINNKHFWYPFVEGTPQPPLPTMPSVPRMQALRKHNMSLNATERESLEKLIEEVSIEIILTVHTRIM